MPISTYQTAEQRAENRAKANAAVAALVASQHEMLLKEHWLDSDVWDDIARERGLRLPAWYFRPEPASVRRWLRKLAIKEKDFLTWGGYSTVADFQRLNPATPLRALIGFLLEYAAERDAATDTLRAKIRPGQ